MSATVKKLEMATENADTVSSLMSLPELSHPSLMALRDIILEVGEDEQIGGVEETLKWNQPAYLAQNKGVGTTIRLGFDEKTERVLLYGHCQSTVIDQWRDRYNDTFEFVGNRALSFSVHESLPKEELVECVWLALTYHKRK